MTSEPNTYEQGYEQDRRGALHAMLQSPAWREVALPALEARRAKIAHQLAKGKVIDMEDVRARQAEYALLSKLIESPQSYFWPEKGA